MKEIINNIIKTLSESNNFSEDFIKLRLGFAREHSKGFIFSTLHGIDFFENLLKPWHEKGEYEDNFRAFQKQFKLLE